MEEHLLIDHHLGQLSEADHAAVDAWLEASPEHQATYTQCIRIWVHAEQAGALAGMDVEGDLQAVRGQMGMEEKKNRRPWWRVAAAIIAAVGLSWAAWQWMPNGTSGELLLAETGADPGVHFTLADGSQIRLNAHSKLSYPKDFNGDKREVTLTGEAWFKVEADPTRPFVIHHGESRTEVLGTEFDIRAYPEEPQTWVSVFEGVVRLQAEKGPKSAVELRKGEAGTFHNGEAKKAEEAVADLNLDSWRTGKLNFENTRLTVVLRALERHHQVRILLIEAVRPRACRFTGNLGDLTLEEALENVAVTLGAKWEKQEGDFAILQVNC